MRRGAKKTLPRRIAHWASTALTDNLGLKALCFTLAISLTAYQRGSRVEQQRTVSVDVVVRLPADNVQRELMTRVPPSVHVTVRGNTREMAQLAQSPLPPVELDLREGQATQIIFEPAMFAMPPGIAVTFIDPVSIELEWQNIIRRPVRIQTSMIGQVADGYVVKSSKVEPQRIIVEGPARLVNVLQFVRLEAFDISGKKEGPHQHMLALDAAPPRTQYIGPATARVAVTIERRLTSRKFSKQRITVVGSTKAKTDPSVVEVTITGLPETLESLSPEMVIPRVQLEDVDFKDQRHGSTVRPITVDLSNVEVQVQPPTATVSW